MKPARIQIHIDKLVLHGFSPLDGQRIGDAMQAELTRLLAAQGLPQSLVQRGAIESIDAGEIRVAPRAVPERVGRELANGLYRGLKR